MITQQEEYKNDEVYTRICLEQIDVLSNMNKSINRMATISDKQLRIIQDNVVLMMQLRREYERAI